MIELMVVVAVISILAAITLPAYQAYATRAKVSEVLLAGMACKTSVHEAALSGIPAAPSVNALLLDIYDSCTGHFGQFLGSICGTIVRNEHFAE